MRRFIPLLLALLAAPAFAGASAYDGIKPLLDANPPTAPADVVKAINESKDAWYPKDVYALIDRNAPPDVIKAAAAKAAVFYDGSQKSLDAQAQAVRDQAPPKSFDVKAPADLAPVLAWYKQVEDEKEAARKTVADLPARGADETEATWDKRVRDHDVAVALAIAPAEGKIDHTVVNVSIPAVLDAYDAAAKCYPKAAVHADLAAVDFFTFRTAMGGTQLTVPGVVDAKKAKTLASLAFDGNNGQRVFDVVSWPICMEPEDAGSLKSGVTLSGKLTRTHKGMDWTFEGNFLNKEGDPVKTKPPKK